MQPGMGGLNITRWRQRTWVWPCLTASGRWLENLLNSRLMSSKVRGCDLFQRHLTVLHMLFFNSVSGCVLICALIRVLLQVLWHYSTQQSHLPIAISLDNHKRVPNSRDLWLWDCSSHRPIVWCIDPHPIKSHSQPQPSMLGVTMAPQTSN